MRRTAITPSFVDAIPEYLEDGVLYISEKYETAVHMCCCGCGEEVVTPLNHAKWHLSRRRGAVSLFPSIGNWNYNCQSHYWIRANRIEWAPSMTRQQILAVQGRDRKDQDYW